MGDKKADKKLKAKIISLYESGVPVYKIAPQVHKCRPWVNKVVEEAINEGKLKRKRFVRQSNITEARLLEIQAAYAEICDYYRRGYTIHEIAEVTKHCFETVNKYVKVAIEKKDLYPKNHEKRKEAVRKHKNEIAEAKGERVYQYKERTFKKAEPTLAPGETVRCTAAISRTCVYGMYARSDCQGITGTQQRCRYSLVTGKCRSIGEDGCSWKACTKYSRISQDNPRLNCAEDI